MSGTPTDGAPTDGVPTDGAPTDGAGGPARGPTAPVPSGSGLWRVMLVVGIALVSLNLRPALAAVGPLVADVRAATGLTNAALGLLTTLPLLGFGLASAATPWFTRRLGLEGTLALALVGIAVGAGVRAVPSTALLFAGTALFGVAIALGNVLLPALVKRDFPDRSGPMTALYSSGIGLGAALAAGVSVPLAAAVGWRGALSAWGLFALLALAVWAPLAARQRPAEPRRGVWEGLRHLARSRRAWEVALFMGLQSLTYYVVLAWLPDLLQTRGLSPEAAGGVLAVNQAAGIAGSIAVPIWAATRDDQRGMIWALAALEALALAGLAVPAMGAAWVWAAALGVVLGGTFGLSLLLLVLRATDADGAAELSGMAQSAGYLVAATGPPVFGGLYDWSGGWTAPLVFLAVVLVAKTWIGTGAGRPGTV